LSESNAVEPIALEKVTVWLNEIKMLPIVGVGKYQRSTTRLCMQSTNTSGLRKEPPVFGSQHPLIRQGRFDCFDLLGNHLRPLRSLLGCIVCGWFLRRIRASA
jgi:hypothetical protein